MSNEENNGFSENQIWELFAKIIPTATYIDLINYLLPRLVHELCTYHCTQSYRYETNCWSESRISTMNSHCISTEARLYNVGMECTNAYNQAFFL